jgi:hypothetical protein
MDSSIAFLMPIVSAVKGLYLDITGKITAQRAAYMDSLPNLTGPAALAADVGAIGDTQGFTSSLCAAYGELNTQLAALDRQAAVLASAEIVRTLIVPGFSPIPLLSAALAPTPLLAGSTTIGWSGGAAGAYLHTARGYSPTLPAQAMPQLVGTIAGAGTQLHQGLPTDVATVQSGTLALTLNAVYPTALTAGQAIVAFGNPTGSSWWGIVAGSGGNVALANQSTSVAITGNPFPITAHWSTSGVTVFDKTGAAIASLAPSSLFPGFAVAPSPLYIAYNAAYVVGVEYI